MKLPLSMPVGRHSLKKWSRSFLLSAWKMRSCGNPPFRNKPRRNPDFLHTKSPPYVFRSRRLLSFLFGVSFRPAVPFSEFLLQNPLLQRHLCRRYRNCNHCANPCHILHIHALNLRRIEEQQSSMMRIL